MAARLGCVFRLQSRRLVVLSGRRALSDGLPQLRINTTGLLGGAHRRAPAAAPALPSSPVQQTPLLGLLRATISMRGPLSVAEFMKLCLGHPTYGYYMRPPEAIFGRKGDFVTSPEISHLFGDLVGVWVVATWGQTPQAAAGQPFRLVECGPGRGVLASDVLRTLQRLRKHLGGGGPQALHLVETSPSCRAAQAAELRCEASNPAAAPPTREAGARTPEPSAAASVSACIGPDGPWPGLPVHWHDRLEDVPSGAPLMLLAHELFDALPVHQFVRTAGGKWAERLVDVEPHQEEAPAPPTPLSPLSSISAPPSPQSSAAEPPSPTETSAGGGGLRMVLAPGPTPAVAAYGDYLSRRYATAGDSAGVLGAGSIVEHCPAGFTLATSIAQRIAQDGGAALIIDYSSTTRAGATVRGIARQAFVDPLSAPGEVDLSADVDFTALREAAEAVPGAAAHGPITQSALLLGLGLEQRLERLVAACGGDASLAQRLVDDATRLAHPDQMGGVYKALAITQTGTGAPPAF